jgi:prolyl 4-hydroxylase
MSVMTNEALDRDRVWVIRDILSPNECTALIRLSEGFGYESGRVADAVVDSVRNNDRAILDDTVLAAELLGRARPFLPAAIDGAELVGFNERFRFYCYNPGQTFKPHRGGSHMRSES